MLYQNQEKTKKTDLELIKEVKANQSNDSFLELVGRHTPLYTKMVNNYSGMLNSSGVNQNDIMEEKFNIFYDSINKYDETRKTKFSSFLGDQVRYYCLNSVNKDHYIKIKGCSLDVQRDENNEFPPENKTSFYLNDTYNDQVIKEDNKVKQEIVYKILDQHPDKRAKKIFQLRFNTENNKNMTWTDIGKQIGLSRQGALNIFNKVTKTLDKEVEKVYNAV